MNSTSQDTIYFTTPSDLLLQTPWKIGAVSFFSILLILVWILVGLAAWNRNYPPIKSKGILLILAMVIGDTAGEIGALYETQILDQTGSFFTDSGYGCSFLFWFPFVLATISVNIQSYRMYRLHFIVNRRLPIHTFRFWLPFIISNIPNAIYYGLMVPPNNQFVTKSPMNNPTGYGCSLALPYAQQELLGSIGSTGILSNFLFGLYIAIQLRRLSASLNESKQMINLYSWIFVGTIFEIINIVSGFNNTIPGKIGSLIYQIIVPLRLCSILVKPVWNCYFNNAAYLKEWKAGLRAPKNYTEANMRFGEKKKNAGGKQLPNREILKKQEVMEGKEGIKRGEGMVNSAIEKTERISQVATSPLT